MSDLKLSVGRDYTTSSRYEYCIYQGGEILARLGGFKSAATARRAGFRAGAALQAA